MSKEKLKKHGGLPDRTEIALLNAQIVPEEILREIAEAMEIMGYTFVYEVNPLNQIAVIVFGDVNRQYKDEQGAVDQLIRHNHSCEKYDKVMLIPVALGDNYYAQDNAADYFPKELIHIWAIQLRAGEQVNFITRIISAITKPDYWR